MAHYNGLLDKILIRSLENYMALGSHHFLKIICWEIRLLILYRKEVFSVRVMNRQHLCSACSSIPLFLSFLIYGYYLIRAALTLWCTWSFLLSFCLPWETEKNRQNDNSEEQRGNAVNKIKQDLINQQSELFNCILENCLLFFNTWVAKEIRCIKP